MCFRPDKPNQDDEELEALRHINRFPRDQLIMFGLEPMDVQDDAEDSDSSHEDVMIDALFPNPDPEADDQELMRHRVREIDLMPFLPFLPRQQGGEGLVIMRDPLPLPPMNPRQFRRRRQHIRNIMIEINSRGGFRPQPGNRVNPIDDNELVQIHEPEVNDEGGENDEDDHDEGM